MGKGKGKPNVLVNRSCFGYGVFAGSSFMRGELIGEIKGRVFVPDETSEYHISFGDEEVIDPRAPFRFLNHSCTPNVEVVYHGDEKGKALYVKALRDILVGEEIRNDYAWNPSYAIPCECGTPFCRGWIVD